MQILIELDSHCRITLQNQLFDAIRQQILDGQLKSGMQMPSSRQLSDQLGVSRNTVLSAYERLVAEGYLFSQETIGTFVNPSLPDESLVSNQNINGEKKIGSILNARACQKPATLFSGKPQNLFNPNRHKLDIDFWVGRPDADTFPTAVWRRLIVKSINQASHLMSEYNDPVGILALRRAIANHLGLARGIDAGADRIIITNGIQEGLNLVARLLINEESTAVIESPCYQGAAYVLESYGAKLHPVPVDKNGLDVGQLPMQDFALAYVTPSHQYPMGSTLALERRVKLLNWASRCGAYILEDDYDSDFRHQGSPLSALASLDKNDSVIYLGTFSKSIGAGIRLGYMVLPEQLVEAGVAVKTLMNIGHAWLDQEVLKEFIEGGHYFKHLRKIRRIYLLRRNCLVETLKKHFGDVQLSGLEGGMHLVWHLDEALPDPAEVQHLAEQVGVGVYSLECGAAHDFGSHAHDRALLLGYSSTSEQQIEDGISRIAKALNI